MSSPTPPPSNTPAPRRRRWWKRVLIGLLVLANVAVFGLYWQLRHLENVIQTTADTIPEVVPELTPTAPESSSPITFLVIGSDSREGLDDLTNFGRADGHRADVIMLIQIHPADDRAQILSLPRDLWVSIPGHSENRINAAYALGDAPLMVRTVRDTTGLPVHHYVEIDFVGFKAIVDELGGVHIDFPYPARDAKSGLSVEAGRQRLDGAQALAYARSRTYQELRGGSWVSVGANDIGRTQRQQQLILAIAKEMARPSSITEAGSLVETFASHLSIDSALAESSLVGLAFSMRGISTERIETATLPTTGTTNNGMSVLLRDEPEASEMIEAFRRGDPLITVEAPKRLTVLNGNGVEGSASRWSEYLKDKGFEIARVGDANAKDFSVTTVLVRPGHLSAGQVIVDALGFGVVEPGTLEEGIDAVVIVGSDAAETSQQSG